MRCRTPHDAVSVGNEEGGSRAIQDGQDGSEPGFVHLVQRGGAKQPVGEPVESIELVQARRKSVADNSSDRHPLVHGVSQSASNA